MIVAYAETDSGGLSWARPIDDGHKIGMIAENIRKERTGVHARIYVQMNAVSLAWGVFNVEKDEDRVRLANSVAQHLNGFNELYPKQFLKKDLDLFCDGLWSASMVKLIPEDMEGNDDQSPPNFYLEPFVLEGGGTIVFAPPGSGKSYTLMLMQVCMDAGINTSLWKVQQTKTLLINLERDRDLVRKRLAAVNRVLGLDPLRTIPALNAKGRSLSDVIDAVRLMVRKRDIECVFLDSISRAGMGDLTENQPVNRIMDSLNGLCRTWVALAHSPRGDESHVFGGIHFDAAADVQVQLLSQQDETGGPLGVGLRIVKDNDIGKRPMSIVALEFAGPGLPLKTVRRAEPGEFPEIEEKRKTSLKQEVIGYLLEVGAATATDIAKALGRNRSAVASLFNSGDGFVRAGRNGRDVLWGVKGTP